MRYGERVGSFHALCRHLTLQEPPVFSYLEARCTSTLSFWVGISNPNNLDRETQEALSAQVALGLSVQVSFFLSTG